MKYMDIAGQLSVERRRSLDVRLSCDRNVVKCVADLSLYKACVLSFIHSAVCLTTGP
jgi:hypothetical protein